jgi:glycosyltransferase involved in cell wall biosynthesis
MPIRLAHVASSDLAIPALAPFNQIAITQGWDVTMITPDGPHVAAIRGTAVRWQPLGLRRRMDPVGDALASIRLARDLRRGRFDIVHTHNIKAGHIGRVVARAVGVPVVVHTVHGMAYSCDTPPLRRRVHATAERIACACADLVFTQSLEDRETLLVTHAVPASKIVAIGNGIDLSRFSPAHASTTRREARDALGMTADDVLFVSASRLIREKGFVELCEAAARVRVTHPYIQLAIAGEVDAERADALDGSVIAAARAAGVRFLGRREDMPALYAASDVVVLASWHEGMPRTLMEGAAVGRPLLTTDVVGCREIVRPPRNGLRVPVRDAQALARAMIELAEAPELRRRLGDANAAEAGERFDIQTVVTRVSESYARLLSKRSNVGAERGI